MKGRVLIVAGSDSGGGAGIQADIKTVTALGAYASTAVTALTAQDTTGVHGIHEIPAAFVRQQMEVVLDDIGADCLKTGMLRSIDIIETVVAQLEGQGAALPLVVDPVVVATSGAELLREDAIHALKVHLIPLATVLTPNIPEAALLTGIAIETLDDMKHAAETLMSLGPQAVLIKGGHLDRPVLRDVLMTEDGMEVFEHERLDTPHTHGTGCTLASAIAAGLAQGLGIKHSVGRGLAFVEEAIRTAPGFGKGHGPLNHAHAIKPYHRVLL